ncbi:MAG: hypothetical protein H7325_09685 [Pedobacter sp.]|nr:hypothetical protein [Pedobacter sp.]
MAKKSIKNLGEQIKSEIEDMGLNQSFVARKMGLRNRQTINKLETRKKFDLAFLQKLKEATGLDYTNYVFNPKTNEFTIINTKETPTHNEKLMRMVIDLQQKTIELLEENSRLKKALL